MCKIRFLKDDNNLLVFKASLILCIVLLFGQTTMATTVNIAQQVIADTGSCTADYYSGEIHFQISIQTSPNYEVYYEYELDCGGLNSGYALDSITVNDYSTGLPPGEYRLRLYVETYDDFYNFVDSTTETRLITIGAQCNQNIQLQGYVAFADSSSCDPLLTLPTGQIDFQLDHLGSNFSFINIELSDSNGIILSSSGDAAGTFPLLPSGSYFLSGSIGLITTCSFADTIHLNNLSLVINSQCANNGSGDSSLTDVVSFEVLWNADTTCFINTSDTSTNVISYLWDFGDGNSSFGEHACHLYMDNGCLNKFVTLHLYFDDGDSASITEEIPICVSDSGSTDCALVRVFNGVVPTDVYPQWYEYAGDSTIFHEIEMNNDQGHQLILLEHATVKVIDGGVPYTYKIGIADTVNSYGIDTQDCSYKAWVNPGVFAIFRLTYSSGNVEIIKISNKAPSLTIDILERETKGRAIRKKLYFYPDIWFGDAKSIAPKRWTDFFDTTIPTSVALGYETSASSHGIPIPPGLLVNLGSQSTVFRNIHAHTIHELDEMVPKIQALSQSLGRPLKVVIGGHGAPGRIMITDLKSELTYFNMFTEDNELIAILDALNPFVDTLHLAGCRIGDQDRGKAFVQFLSNRLGAVVTAHTGVSMANYGPDQNGSYWVQAYDECNWVTSNPSNGNYDLVEKDRFVYNCHHNDSAVLFFAARPQVQLIQASPLSSHNPPIATYQVLDDSIVMATLRTQGDNQINGVHSFSTLDANQKNAFAQYKISGNSVGFKAHLEELDALDGEATIVVWSSGGIKLIDTQPSIPDKSIEAFGILKEAGFWHQIKLEGLSQGTSYVMTIVDTLCGDTLNYEFLLPNWINSNVQLVADRTEIDPGETVNFQIQATALAAGDEIVQAQLHWNSFPGTPGSEGHGVNFGNYSQNTATRITKPYRTRGYFAIVIFKKSGAFRTNVVRVNVSRNYNNQAQKSLISWNVFPSNVLVGEGQIITLADEFGDLPVCQSINDVTLIGSETTFHPQEILFSDSHMLQFKWDVNISDTWNISLDNGVDDWDNQATFDSHIGRKILHTTPNEFVLGTDSMFLIEAYTNFLDGNEQIVGGGLSLGGTMNYPASFVIETSENEASMLFYQGDMTPGNYKIYIETYDSATDQRSRYFHSQSFAVLNNGKNYINLETYVSDTGYVDDEMGWVYDEKDQVIAQFFNPMGEALGRVTCELFVDSNSELQTYQNAVVARRNFVFNLDSVPNSSLTGLRLFITNNELLELMSINPSINDIGDIQVLKYNGSNEDGSLANNDSGAIHYDTITPFRYGQKYGGCFVDIRVSTFSEFWLMGVQNSGSALPVTLLEFNAEKHKETQSLLTWSTAQEINSDYFEIQRANPAGEFETIGSINAAGESAQIREYLFVDVEPHFGMNYYRLKQFDRDGQFEYSHIESVFFDQVQREVFQVTPTLVRDHLNIAYNGDIEEYDVLIIDSYGRIIIKTNASQPRTKLDLSELLPGVYQVVCTDGNQNQVVPITKY